MDIAHELTAELKHQLAFIGIKRQINPMGMH
jgi:hypothetical protein